MKVSEAMIRDVSTIFEDETIEDFIIFCLRQNKSGLPVVDEEFRVVGFLSESDIIKSALPSYFSLLQSASFIPDTHQFVIRLGKIKDDQVSQHMVKPPVLIKPDDTVIYAADLLIKNGLKIIPVVDDEGKLMGIINRIYLIHAATQGKIDR
ncbi:MULTISPECIES: HPP family protein [unclassified Mesotoga]|jgi:CBS domain-containing protein|uniref:CBS domain-containing protein n=1 Tax=Mesotoga infera TaxID=1236046 RepID=A0A101I9D5_9BACT|nr:MULTISPECIES: CBS domain-containing protein [unclassified Mesotoga]KUK68514.1 MAG: CBS-domain-containing membrane protein [Mesotoga infera]KUK91116.1 MAG: CBS-domain-containing membrane protein [Mesotoga infera]PZC52269.1 CBS domain containing membrane protein [Mesotoga sp. TolDC]HCO70122.1 CBS domain-containing protein [Mesotoga infera]